MDRNGGTLRFAIAIALIQSTFVPSFAQDDRTAPTLKVELISVEPSQVPAEDGYLEQAIAVALERNPTIRRLAEEHAAALARVRTVGVPADPMVGFNVFGKPMMMGDGRMRGDFMFSQTIPWLKRLQAEQQQAVFEALAVEQMLRDRRLAVEAEVKEAYYLLYLLDQQIRINDGNQEVMDRLVRVATQRVATGASSQGDVLLGTLELSRLAEERLSLDQRLAAAKARFNRLLDQPVETEIAAPTRLVVTDDEYALAPLFDAAAEVQPEIVAARLRTQAADWGVQVARLKSLPDIAVNYQRMFMDRDEPAMGNGHGGNPWSMGLSMNIPLWRNKYRSITEQARRERQARQASVDDLLRQTEAALLELVEQHKAATRTAKLYQRTILPQARQTLQADQQAYGQGKVEFDRVVNDFRNLLTLEVGYHRAIAEQATAIARMEQIVGADLQSPVEPTAQRDALPPK